MTTKPCLKCGHVADYEGELPTACPMCCAIYSRVESALARGETINRAKLEVIVRRQRRLASALEERPSRLVSVFIALGFALLLFALLAGVAVFGMIFTAPGSGRGDAWNKGSTLFLNSLLIGGATASVICMGLSLARRPLAGILAGTGIGLVAGVAAGFVLS